MEVSRGVLLDGGQRSHKDGNEKWSSSTRSAAHDSLSMSAEDCFPHGAPLRRYELRITHWELEYSSLHRPSR